MPPTRLTRIYSRCSQLLTQTQKFIRTPIHLKGKVIARAMRYKEEVKRVWNCENDIPKDADERLREIVRFATLAPSSHNTQCWAFRLGDGTITVLPDFSRRCPVVDPDNHHLYVTLGCAVENIIVAARAYGLEAQVDSTTPSKGIDIHLTPCKREVTPLFEAITKRQCTRAEYDGTPLSQEEIDLLQSAGTGNGVQALFLTDASSMETVLEYIVLANTSQIDNPEFAKELKSWVRFGESDAVATGDGLYGVCMGSPSGPRWIGGLIFDLVLRSGPENAKIKKQVQSSAGIAVFVSERDDPVHWVEAGRCYERFALQATALGIRNAFLNMPVEEADVRPRFAKALGLEEGSRPDLVVRFGRGPEMPRSLRRPVESVLQYDKE